MQRRIEERVEAQQAAKADEVREPGMQAAQRGDGERDQEEPERPIAGKVGDGVDRVGFERERAGAILLQQPEHRKQTEQVDDDFEVRDPAVRHTVEV